MYVLVQCLLTANAKLTDQSMYALMQCLYTASLTKTFVIAQTDLS